MLTESTISYIYGLAESLGELGVGIAPIPGTPIDNLVITATPSFDVMSTLEIKNNAKAVLVNTITGVTKNTDMMSPHSAAVAALSEHLAENVTRHISNARNVVKPAVESYLSAIIERSSAYSHVDPMAGFKIDKVYIPEPLLSESLLDDLKIHKNRQVNMVTEGLPVGNATDEELTSYLFTGHNSVDKEIRTWLAYIDANMLREVWNDYFATSSTEL